MRRTLIETVRVIGGRAPLWPLHLGRLTESCLALKLPIPDLIEPRGGPDRVIRFELRSTGLELTDRPALPPEPLHLITAAAPHRGYPHKVAERAWLEAALATAKIAGGEDALLFDAEGRLVEASRWAVGWWEGERLCFPALTLGGLPSVARARLAQVARGGITVGELLRDDVRTRPLVACNAARGVVPVFLVDWHPLLQNHRTLALQRRFWGHSSA